MLFLRLAARNALRNRRRTAITVAAIAVGMAALLFLWAFIDGVNEQMIENSTRYLAGHIQVHGRGYHDDPSLDRILGTSEDRVVSLMRASGASAVSRRLEASALASVGEKSRGILVMGMDPRAEAAVTTLSRTVSEGAFLSVPDATGVVVGARVAEALGAGVGSELVLVTQAADGSIGAGRFRVRGIFRTRIDMLDGNYVLMALPAAQDLLATGDAATTIAGRWPDRSLVGAARARLERELGDAQEVLPWEKLLPAVVQSVSFHQVVGNVLLLVLFIVVAVGVANTLLMSVMERTREFGVLMALGTSRARLTRVVFYEACLLGFGGLVIGAVAGISIVQYYAVKGMDFGRYVRAMETMQGLTSFIYPLARIDRAVLISAVVFLVAVLAALYPALRTARLSPVAAIRNLPHDSLARHRAKNARTLPNAIAPRLPLLAKIATRSIGRNPQRSLMTVAATSFGVGAFVFLTGFVDGYLVQLVANSTGYVTGQVQVQHPKFRTEMDAANSLSDANGLLRAVRDLPLVAAAAPRVQTMALANSAGQAVNIALIGIEPAAEERVTLIHRAINQGVALKPGADRDMVIGDRLAKKLRVRLGEKVVVMAQAADGTVGSAAHRVAGIFDTGSDAFDSGMAFITLAAAQNLLAMPGERVSTIAVKLADSDQVRQATAAIELAVKERGAVAVSWRSLLPELDQMIEYVRVVVRLITGIVLSVVAIGVMNTLLMSVMERTRELGIMMALGTPPRSIIALVLCESVVLATAGIFGGFVLGLPLVEYFGRRGIDLSSYAAGVQSIPGLTGVIFPAFVPRSLLWPSVNLLMLSLVAALYPAWRAARLQPATAIRHA